MRVVDKMKMLSEDIFDALRDGLKDLDDPEIRDQALLLLQAKHSGEMDDPLRVIRNSVIEGIEASIKGDGG
jgi:hypothetical protein